MAIYHLHVGIVSRKTGRSSVAAAAYRSGEKLRNDYNGLTHDYTNKSNAVNSAAYRSGEKLEHDGEIYDYTRKSGVVHNEIMLPENATRDFEDRATLWNAVEKAEKRKDAQTARDIDVALPVEFTREEQIGIMREYIQENFVDKGMIADFAIHDKEDGNPHAHILLTTRNVDEQGFGNKNRDWNKVEHLKQWRENWADVCNERLREKGLHEQIDHRTLKAQGIDREPTIHRGVACQHMERKGLESDRAREYREIVAGNEVKKVEFVEEYMHELKDGYLILDKEITTIQHENAEARRDMNILRRDAEDITERTGHIQNMRGHIDELREERQNMGILKNKKHIDEQIKRLETSHEQARNFFTRTYKISPEQAELKVKELENKAKSKEHFQERLKEKLTPLVKERDDFKLEYQRRKLISGVQTDKPRNQAERTLETITEHNFNEIVKSVEEEQAKILIEIREREKQREMAKVISRSYI